MATLAQQAVLMKVPNMAKPNDTVSFQAAKETKQVPIDDAFPDRTVNIESNLDAK